MAQAQQTIKNDKDGPIYISIEPWPMCFELEPGDKLTLRYGLPDSGDALDVNFVNDRELVIWPNGNDEKLEVLFNGAPAEDRNWNFKHR